MTDYSSQGEGRGRNDAGTGSAGGGGPTVGALYVDADGNVVWADERAAEFLEPDGPELVGSDVEEVRVGPQTTVLRGDERDRSPNPSERLSREGSRTSTSVVVLSREEFPLDDGRVELYVDVTDRVLGGNHVTRGRSKRGSRFELADEYRAVLLDRDGVVLDASGPSGDESPGDTGGLVGRQLNELYPPPGTGTGGGKPLLEGAATEGRAERDRCRVRPDEPRSLSRVVAVPVLDAGGEILAYGVVTEDLGQRRERDLALREETAFSEGIVEAQPDVVYAIDRRGNFVRWNDRLAEVTGYTDEEIADADPTDFFVPSDREAVARVLSKTLDGHTGPSIEATVLTGSGREIPYEFNGSAITDDEGTVVGVAGVGRDLTDRTARERTVKDQRDRLSRLASINDVIRGVSRALVDAESRRSVERAVVEQLADTGPYDLAVVGELDPDFESFDPRTWAGSVEGFADRATTPDPEGPCVEAARSGSVEVVDDVREDPMLAGLFGGSKREFPSVAAVPLVAGDRTFGLLVLFDGDENRFDDDERAVVSELGETIGNAMRSIETRRLLFADEVLEVEFRTNDGDAVFVSLSETLDCRLEVDQYLPMPDGRTLFYVSVTGVDPDRFTASAAEEGSVETVRTIENRDDGGIVEMVVTGSTITQVVFQLGAKSIRTTAERGVATVVVHARPGTNLRGLIEGVEGVYPETQFVSKRRVERPVETTDVLRESVSNGLTDKQRHALEAAFYGGYFEWPTRDSSAAELAETLGIAAQTYHQHLRIAQDKVFSALFDDGTDT